MAGGGQVAAELVEHQRGGRVAGLAAAATGAGLRGLLALVAAQQLDDLLTHAGQLGAQLDEHLGGDALALTDQAEQDVLGADVVVAELQRLAQAQLETFLARGVKGMWPDGACWPWPMISSTWLRTPSSEMPSDSSDLAATPFTLVNKSQQDVLGADVVVVEHPGFFLSQDDDPAGTVGESLKHRWLPALHRQVGHCAAHAHGTCRPL